MRVLLTGATGGIGRELARELTGAGAFVVLQGRNEVHLSALRESLDETRTVICAGDLMSHDDIDAISVVAQHQRINVLINNAGVNQFSLFDSADIETTISVNIVGPMMLTQKLLAHLKSQPESLIVAVGSAFGSIGFPGYVTYSATKHAIKGFSEALRRELSDTSVEVIYVSPRATRTSMNSSAAERANEALGVKTDSAAMVARRILSAMRNRRPRSQLGFVERLQIRINALLPGVVDCAIARQLATIKQFVTPKETFL
jgi:short-subunit dehydrogenase